MLDTTEIGLLYTGLSVIGVVGYLILVALVLVRKPRDPGVTWRLVLGLSLLLLTFPVSFAGSALGAQLNSFNTAVALPGITSRILSSAGIALLVLAGLRSSQPVAPKVQDAGFDARSG